MRLPRLLVAVILGLLAICSAAAHAGAASGGVRVGAAPQLPTGATFAGAVAPERQLDLYVPLEPRDPAALERFAEEVAAPGSPLYGQYLSVPEFAARFGASPSQVATVRSALAARGLQVGAASANHLSLSVTATAAEAEDAFGTAIDRVQTASGRVAFANRSGPQVPAAAAPFVQGVLGLDDLRLSHRADDRQSEGPTQPDTPRAVPAALTPVATGGPQPCAEAIATAESESGYTADQIASAYGLPGFYEAGDFGAGQTVALLEAESFRLSEIEIFQACYGTDVEVTAEDVGKSPDDPNEHGEAALDIEQLVSLAPGARIHVYQTKNDGDVYARILSAYVSQDIAKVMSSSWASCEPEEEGDEMSAVDTLLQEAAAQGQSFFNASGDWGSSACYEEIVGQDKDLAVNFPGSDPFATAVGGTRMEDPTLPTPIDYLWNEAPEWGAGGGGRSERFPMPSYQLQAAPTLNVVSALSSGEPCGLAFGYCRQVPDVSADAAPETGYVIRAEGGWEVNGGTSAAAPFWAAFVTLTNASPGCGGTAIGFANPALYEIAGSTAYAADFRDVTGPRPGGKPTTSRLSDEKPFPAGPGYDMASGLGTPRGTALAASLCALVNPPAPPSVPTTPATTTTNPPTPSVKPASARVVDARLGGVGHGRPRFSATLAAREGARIKALTITLPPGLVTTAEAGTIKAGIVVRDGAGKLLLTRVRATEQTIHIDLPARPQVTVTIGPSALLASPKLADGARTGDGRSLGFVLSTRESGGRGGRFLLSLGI